jgi:glycosyltransferase involved in cell wall biosynthesis
VVIPTLNEASNIGCLLRSLLEQEHPPLQVIVADGGSGDGTLAIVRQVAHEAVGGPVQVLAIECERSVSRQRNEGANRAHGDILVFMDADDRAPRGFLRRVASSYRRWPFAVACPWLRAREPSLPIRGAYFLFNVGFWLGQGWLRLGSGVCILVRREVFERSGGFDPSLHLGEDIHLIRRASGPGRGWHRHLLVPLETSGRRYESDGFWRLSLFYLRITPLLLLGLWKYLQRHEYRPLNPTGNAEEPPPST